MTMFSDMEIILASASPRRHKILSELGLTFRVIVPDVEEVHWHHDPCGMVMENARRKYTKVAANHPGALVIAADTIVVFGSRSIGKPSSMEDARAMLRQFSGNTQIVYTGTAIGISGNEIQLKLTESQVQFRKFDDNLIDRYFTLINPMDRAGAYDIDRHSELIISEYRGSRTNIMGLPEEVIIDFLKHKL